MEAPEHYQSTKDDVLTPQPAREMTVTRPLDFHVQWRLGVDGVRPWPKANDTGATTKLTYAQKNKPPAGAGLFN